MNILSIFEISIFINYYFFYLVNYFWSFCKIGFVDIVGFWFFCGFGVGVIRVIFG